jgi:2-keto-3-deoxy-L-rhamnonate aldolase RhmA/quercetin dioxygenase-like cupin family protein
VKIAAIRALRAKLAADQPTFGLWVTLESPSITEMAVALGFDWVVIDAEHGHLDWKEITEHLRATVRSQTVALVRLAELNGGLVKRALDCGADGVVLPWIETADQLREAIAWARYPLEGRRGIGGERATCWGQAMVEHTQVANEHVLVVPIIESVRAAENIAELAAVDGAEMFYFGPADFSSTAGYRGQWEGPEVAAQILAAQQALVAAGKTTGVIATSPADLIRRRQEGFRLIGLGMDAGILARNLRSLLAQAGIQREFQTDLQPQDSGHAQRVAALSGAGQRLELRRDLQQIPAVELAPGVLFRGLAGTTTGTQGFTVGTVTFAPGAFLPHHTHTFTESITVLEGSAVCEIEGRIHRLGPLDHLSIPAHTIHQSRNESPAPVTFLIAMGSNEPTRTDVDARHLIRREIPVGADVATDPERVVRFRTARRHHELSTVSGIRQFFADHPRTVEMSGGYLILHSAESLPLHHRLADEVLFVISGTLLVHVEERQHELTAGQALTIPAGTRHAWRNVTSGPVEVLWVSGSPTAERVS